MNIQLFSTFGIRVFLGLALWGLLTTTASAQTTTITFDGAAAGNNVDIARNYGSFITGNSTGFDTAGGATPNIGLTWLGNIANEWEYHTGPAWVHESPVHVAQLNFINDPGTGQITDNNAEIVFSPINGRSVVINSFLLSGANDTQGNTFDWEIVGTAFSGTETINPATNTTINNIGFTGDAGVPYTLRFTRQLDSQIAAVGTALDDLSFGETLLPTAEVVKLTVNRSTGNISIDNIGANTADIIGYSITSSAGALDASNWTTIKGNYDVNGNGSVDGNDAWTAFPQFTPGTEFTEFQFGGDGGSITTTNPTNSINLGNSWIQSPTEDLQFELILSDNRVNTYSVDYVGGSALEVGDLNFDGEITALDWPIYNAGRGVDLSGMSLLAAYQMGDLDGDLDNDIADFVAFKTLYEAANGVGSFTAIGLAVPEPTSGLLLLTALAFLPGMRPRRDNKVSGILYKWRRMMKNQLIATFGSLAAMAMLAGTTQATVLTFDGNSSNQDMAFDYGSNKGLVDDSPEFITTGPSGATPNITLAWGPNPSTNVLEFHNSNNWIAPMSGGKLQFDVDASSQTAFPADPTVDFSVPSGISVVINSLIIGHATDMHIADGHEPAHEWTMNILELSGGVPVVGPPALSVTTTTLSAATQGTGSAEVVNFNFTGAPGVSYRLLFDDGGDDSLFPANHDGTIGNHPRGGIDNLSFSETVISLLSLDLLVNTTNGAITLENNTGSPITIDSYEITSLSGSLDPVAWDSLEDQDFEGNGVPGTGNGWEEAGGVEATQLIESYLLGDTTISDGASISLGNAFDFDKLGVQDDLGFGYRIAGDDTFLTPGTIVYSPTLPVMDADFDDDGDVDGSDFLAWQRGFGSMGSATNAQGDANGDGNVDSQDLAVWQGAFGAGSGASAVAAAAATTVPEPDTACLFGFALLGLMFIMSRQSLRCQTEGYGQLAVIRCRSRHVGRIAAIALIFLVAKPAMAAKTTDRMYEFGDGGASTMLDSQSQSASDRQNLSVPSGGGTPSFVNVNTGPLARPGTSVGDRGVQLDGVDDVLSGIPLNRPDETAGPSFTGIGPLIFGFPFNYDTITARGMQMWVYPDASAIGNEASPKTRQGIVFDTITAGGVSITADGKWTQVNDSAVTDGVIEATVPVIGDRWYQVMQHIYPSGAPGAPKLASGFLTEAGFTSVVYVDGIAVSVINGNPAPGEQDNGMRVGVLAVGAEEISGDTFTPAFDNYFQGVVDDLELYVFGDNSSVSTFPSGQDYGTFNLFSDNNWIVDQIAAIPGGVLNMGDINRDGSVNSGDVTALVAGWRTEKRLKGRSRELNVGDWETWGWGDLNTDGLVDLQDAILLNDSLIAAGQGALNFDLFTAVPEPTSLVLGLLGWTLCLGRKRGCLSRRRHRQLWQNTQ